MLDLYEVLDISEIGVAVQCSSPMKVGQQVDLCLDLAEASGQISATARVVWSDSTGRVGLGFPLCTVPAQRRLREWLFLNAMAGAANAASSAPRPTRRRSLPIPRPNYTDTLTAASAVQREAESLGADLEAVLSLIASLRSHISASRLRRRNRPLPKRIPDNDLPRQRRLQRAARGRNFAGRLRFFRRMRAHRKNLALR